MTLLASGAACWGNLLIIKVFMSIFMLKLFSENSVKGVSLTYVETFLDDLEG